MSQRGRNVGPTPVLLVLISLLRFSAAAAASVYDVLPKYGLPPGLLPSAVKSYELSETDGSFSVVLEKPCYVEFEYLVYYEERISGKLSYGAIRELKGIQVKKLFVWLGVDEIKVDLPPSGSIYFQVGFINKRLNLDQFNTVHSCRGNNRLFQLPTKADDIPMLLTE